MQSLIRLRQAGAVRSVRPFSSTSPICSTSGSPSKEVPVPSGTGSATSGVATIADHAAKGGSPGKALTERPEGVVAQAGIVSGAPVEIHRRQVRIYRPSPPTTQSAKQTSHHWRIDWDILQGGGRWENPLMGWASTADYMQGTSVKFQTKEDAIHFCEKQGYEFYVQEPQKQKFKPKSYSTNYLYSPRPLRICTTK